MKGLAYVKDLEGFAQCTYIRTKEKREVLPSLVSPDGEVNYIVLVYLVLAYLRVRLSAVGTYCVRNSSCDKIPTPILWVFLYINVSVAVVGFSGELLFTVETLYLDYLCHYFSSTSYAPTS